MRLTTRNLVMSLFGLLARHDAHRIAGSWFARRIRLVRPAAPGRRPYNVLVMEKGGLGLDILSSLPAEDGYAIYFGNRTDLQSMARAFLPEVGDYSYRLGSEDAKLRYRAFLDRIWRRVGRRLRIDAVLSANIVYYAERELSAVLARQGVPHIVLHKECLKTPEMARAYHYYYREGVGPILAARVVSYNETERASQVASGMVRQEQTAVSGMPRLDRFHRWRCGPGASQAPRTDVLFLFFNETVGIQDPVGGYLSAELRRGWVDLTRQTYAAILRLAHEHPAIRVTVKAKGFPGGADGLSRHAFGTADLPANLVIEVKGDPFDFITAAKVVCGFNTTGLLEAVAAGIPVVIPHYAETLSPVFRDSLVDLAAAATHAESPDRLVETLAALARQDRKIDPELGPAQVEALERWVGNADGKAGERVSRIVLAEIRGGT